MMPRIHILLDIFRYLQERMENGLGTNLLHGLFCNVAHTGGETESPLRRQGRTEKRNAR
jgi:hypothetical protein